MKLIKTIEERWSPPLIRLPVPSMKNNWHCCSKLHAGPLPATMPRRWAYYCIRLANIRKLMPGSRSASPGGNRAWAPDAPVLLVSCGYKNFPGTDVYNRHWIRCGRREHLDRPCKPPRWECNCIRWPASTGSLRPAAGPRHGKDRTCNDDDARLPRPGRPAGGAVPHPGNAAPGTQGSEELRT